MKVWSLQSSSIHDCAQLLKAYCAIERFMIKSIDGFDLEDVKFSLVESGLPNDQVETIVDGMTGNMVMIMETGDEASIEEFEHIFKMWVKCPIMVSTLRQELLNDWF